MPFCCKYDQWTSHYNSINASGHIKDKVTHNTHMIVLLIILIIRVQNMKIINGVPEYKGALVSHYM